MNKSKNRNLYAVILAGGSGTRFWPLSRKTNPKQFLNITGKGTLFEGTLKRIRPKVPSNNVIIITNVLFQKEVSREAKRYGIPKSNILLEPKGRNTAPAICWAASRIHKINQDAILAVLPSDHLILNKKNFLKDLGKAVKLAEEGKLVTLGIVPTRPETGYGYLRTKKIKCNGKNIIKVEKFTEKPSTRRAKQFLRRKNYLWNSGMFVWRTSVILREFRKHLPKVYDLLGNSPQQAHIRRVWGKVPSISVDYGILERSNNVVTVPAGNIGWSDLGSWEALLEVLTKDKKGNILRGDVLQLDCHNMLVRSDDRLIAAVDLKDLIVIDTRDALLICNKDSSQKVKEIVSMLEKSKSTVT